MTLLLIILFSIISSLGAIAAAAVFLLFKDQSQKNLIPYLVSFATGTLLASSLLGLIPEALQYISIWHVLITLLIGILAFFILEKVVIWRHCHNIDCLEAHKSSAAMILVGDAIHNSTDGVIIAASFMVSIPLGIAVSLSVIAHEIPQELGDFGILLHSGYSRRRAFLYNTLSSSTTILTAIISYFALDFVKNIIPYVMVISAASFLYIALVDLSPELHRKIGLKQGIIQVLLVLAGIGTTILFFFLLH